MVYLDKNGQHEIHKAICINYDLLNHSDSCEIWVPGETYPDNIFGTALDFWRLNGKLKKKLAYILFELVFQMIWRCQGQYSPI